MGGHATTTWYCGICRSETLLEPVPCDDGHGADCPEWLCVQCAVVVVLGSVAEDVDGPGRRRASA